MCSPCYKNKPATNRAYQTQPRGGAFKDKWREMAPASQRFIRPLSSLVQQGCRMVVGLFSQTLLVYLSLGQAPIWSNFKQELHHSHHKRVWKYAAEENTRGIPENKTHSVWKETVQLKLPWPSHMSLFFPLHSKIWDFCFLKSIKTGMPRQDVCSSYFFFWIWKSFRKQMRSIYQVCKVLSTLQCKVPLLDTRSWLVIEGSRQECFPGESPWAYEPGT